MRLKMALLGSGALEKLVPLDEWKKNSVCLLLMLVLLGAWTWLH